MSLKQYLAEAKRRNLERFGPAGYRATDIPRLIAIVEAQAEALGSIREYWNQDHNEMAMADACHHAVHKAGEALAKAEAIAGGEG